MLKSKQKLQKIIALNQSASLSQPQYLKSLTALVIVCLSLQLEFERSQVRRLEKEQRRITDQLEEERAQHKQLSCALAKECKWASARALEEGHRLTELGRKLDKVLNILNPGVATYFLLLHASYFVFCSPGEQTFSLSHRRRRVVRP